MKPTWWLLYAIGLLLVGLLALVEIFVPAGGLQSILEITVVIGSFGLMALWLRHNRVAMELEEHDRRRGTVGNRRPAFPLRQVAKPAKDQEAAWHHPCDSQNSWARAALRHQLRRRDMSDTVNERGESLRPGHVSVSRTGLGTILVGLDGSPEGDRAVELSLRWARATGARLVGLGIVDEPTIRRPEPVPMGAGYYKHEKDERLLADARRRVEQFLRDFVRRCAEQGIACEVLEKTGLPHEQIVLTGQQHDLVVLPRQSHFHFETEREPDDTVERVLRHSARPVVIVPQRLGGSGPVVVAYDDGAHAARALQVFQTLGVEIGAEVLVVSVHEDETEAVARAERAVTFLDSHGIRARHATATTREPAAPVILRMVQEADARLLVAGMRDRRRLTELFSGSVTQALLKGAQVPVFLYG